MLKGRTLVVDNLWITGAYSQSGNNVDLNDFINLQHRSVITC